MASSLWMIFGLDILGISAPDYLTDFRPVTRF